jgi:hypothetical protein
MKNRNEISNFKQLLGQNRARHARTARIRPTVARPQCRTDMGQCGPQPTEAGPRPAPTCAGCARRAASWPGRALSKHHGAAWHLLELCGRRVDGMNRTTAAMASRGGNACVALSFSCWRWCGGRSIGAKASHAARWGVSAHPVYVATRVRGQR